MSIRCVLGRLCVRETRRFYRPGKQSVSEGGSIYAAAQMLRDRRRRKPLVLLGLEPDGAELLHALGENDLAWSVFVLPAVFPSAEYVETAGRLYKADGCDCIVALGGSTVMDTAKAAAAWVVNTRVFQGKKTHRRLNAPLAPMIFAIPTQVCADMSLSETTVRDDNGVSRTVLGKALVPAMVLLDPAFLENAPRKELAAAGFEGLCHAVEAYITPGKGDSVALTLAARAVKGFLENLEPCWNDGGTSAQRAALMEASRKAGLAAAALGYGYIRSMCRGLCAFGVDRGEAYSVMLPLVLDKYGNDTTEKLSRLSSLAGVMDAGSQSERAVALITRVRDMAFRLGLPEKLRGISSLDLDEIAYRTAMDSRSLPPVYWTEGKCRKILEISTCSDDYT